MGSRSDRDDPEQDRVSSSWCLDAIGCFDRALYVSRSCLCKRNMHQDNVPVDLMGNQIGSVKGATLVSSIELTDGDGFHGR